MTLARHGFFATVIATTLAGCATVPLAPGADQVKITRTAADVASCTPVGNIDARVQVDLDPSFAANQMRNQAVGLGGNVVFDTTVNGKPSGVIYRCAK